MKIKLVLTLSMVFSVCYWATGQSIYKVQVTNEQGVAVKGEWRNMTQAELTEHIEFKKGAEVKVEEAVDFKAGLKKQVSSYTKGEEVRIETRAFDPEKTKVKEGYKPVDIIYVTFQKIDKDEQ